MRCVTQLGVTMTLRQQTMLWLALLLWIWGDSTARSDTPSAPSPLSTDRPGFTNGSDVVGTGVVQIEMGLAQTRAQAASGGGTLTDLPQMLVRQGITPTLEIRCTLPDYFTGQAGQSGFGDAQIGAKYRFYQSKDGNTKAALTPSLSLPTGARALTSGHADPALTLGAQTQSGARWGVSGNLNLADPTQSGRRNFTLAPSASASYQLTRALSVYGDIYDAVPKTGAPSPITDGGLVYLVNPNVQVDAEMGVGLGGNAPTRFVGGGIGVRF